MNAIQQLERRALDAYRAGQTWAQFWAEHAGAIGRAEPYDARRYHRLVRRLLALIVAGNEDGAEPMGDGLQPWERDDARPSDTQTTARCLIPLRSIPGLQTADGVGPRRWVLPRDDFTRMA
jgi:hypothetical protein